MKGFLITLGVILAFVLLFFIGRAMGVVSKVTEPDTIITNYEEFENMYDTCNQVCDNIKALDKADVSHTSAFSEEERLLALENQLNRWIREYNAKSRQITRNLWKSDALPYQLSREDFICN